MKKKASTRVIPDHIQGQTRELRAWANYWALVPKVLAALGLGKRDRVREGLLNDIRSRHDPGRTR